MLPAALAHEVTKNAEVPVLLQSLLAEGIGDDHSLPIGVWVGNPFIALELA